MNRFSRLVILIALLMVAALACSQPLNLLTRAEATATVVVTSTRATSSSPEASATPPATALAPIDTPPPSPTATAEATIVWPAAAATPMARFDPLSITEDERRTWQQLSDIDPPVRDDVQLAQSFAGVPDPLPTSTPGTPQPPAPGTVIPFTVLNIDSNVFVTIDAVLAGSSERAYFWFDTSTPRPTDAELQSMGQAFDNIYEQVVEAFGAADGPGIDDDPRVHILHASPAALCDNAERCGLAGYFSSSDALPRIVSERSNERDMFVMNADNFGSSFYLNVLAHEFRHMVEDNYDRSDADWEIEGSAMLAEELVGYSGNALARGNAFLENPDQQLNRWPEENTYLHYGQGYLLNRYIYDRLGPDLYRQFGTHPANGLDAVTAVARENGLSFDGQQLWFDWLAALAIHDHPQAPERYRIGEGGLDMAAMTTAEVGEVFDTTVQQYAADYYHIEDGNSLTLQFEGSRRVPLLDTGAASGQHYWYANRANYSHLQLTRALDLRDVTEATLQYSVYHDIEVGYDFAYVAVSSDGGSTWQGLVGEQMQGLEEIDNPAGTALTERFYTGQSNGWVEERIDLTPFAGQEILLRFSYVTDPILTHGGMALDNISIPEIGFYDDAESENEGWDADGFTRVTATLPQQWHLQLITFPEGAPLVTTLDTDAAQMLEHSLDLAQNGGEAIVIVAAYAPLTLERAEYRLEIGDR